MEYEKIMRELKANANPKNVEGMARFGINSKNALGISIPTLRSMAKKIGKNHALAHELWDSGIHEARLLAAFIDEPKELNEDQVDKWVADFDSWDVCDQVCSSLFDKALCAYKKAFEWSGRKEEFVKRAGFVMMAALSVHDKKASDSDMMKFLPIIKRESGDGRNFVKKAVNWALRQIGKRNRKLNAAAIRTARKLAKMDSASAKWIAKDALRELESEAVRKRLR